ncbi:hypothetical protein J3Q64DRAFT_1824821 [Phycomyces blakesleeanus]|uniref:Transcription factor domain-containing protein n=1 Tax=Phycomyces blakesleeanus TaxID=4837 RepID=A0ABR3AP05_PHYBL
MIHSHSQFIPQSQSNHVNDHSNNNTSPCKRCEENNIQCDYDHPRKRSSNPTQQDDMLLLSELDTSNQSIYTNPINSPLQYQRTPVGFSSLLYESIHISSDTRLPPLFCDFFHLSVQPSTIWKSLVHIFQKKSQKSQKTQNSDRSHQEELRAIITESLGLFSVHNILYSSFIDMAHLQNVMSSVVANPLDKYKSATEWLLIDIIVALTLQAAHRTLLSVCSDVAPDIHHCSQSFYSQANRQFWRLTYPTIPEREPNMVLSQNLVRAAILISHYQCTSISEDQALVTLRTGVGFAQICKLSSYSEMTMMPMMPKAAILDTEEQQRLCILYKTLIGWDTWFRFYLYQPNPGYQDNTVDHCLKLFDSNFYYTQGNQQRVIHIIEIYTSFIKSLLRSRTSPIGVQTIKDQFDWLERASLINLSNTRSPQNKYQYPTELTSCSASVISLYHQILILQDEAEIETEAAVSDNELSFYECGASMCIEASIKVIQIANESISRNTTAAAIMSDVHHPTLLHALCWAVSGMISSIQNGSHHSPRLSPILNTSTLTRTRKDDQSCTKFSTSLSKLKALLEHLESVAPSQNQWKNLVELLNTAAADIPNTPPTNLTGSLTPDSQDFKDNTLPSISISISSRNSSSSSSSSGSGSGSTACSFPITEPTDKTKTKNSRVKKKRPFTYLTNNNTIGSDQNIQKEIRQRVRVRSKSGPIKIDYAQSPFLPPSAKESLVTERDSQHSHIMGNEDQWVPAPFTTSLQTYPALKSPKANTRPRVKRTRSCSDSYSSLDMDGLNKLSLALDMCSTVGTRCKLSTLPGERIATNTKTFQKHVWSGLEPNIPTCPPPILNYLNYQNSGYHKEQPSEMINVNKGLDKDFFNESTGMIETLHQPNVPASLSISTTPNQSVHNGSVFGYLSDMSPILSTGNLPCERQPTTLFEETQPSKEEKTFLWAYNNSNNSDNIRSVQQNSYQGTEDRSVKVDELRRDGSCDLFYTSVTPQITPCSLFSSPLPWTNPPAYSFQRAGFGQSRSNPMKSTAVGLFEHSTEYVSSSSTSPQETTWETTSKEFLLYPWDSRH